MDKLVPKNPRLNIQLLCDGDVPVYVSTFKGDDKTYSRKTETLTERLIVGSVYDCHTKWGDNEECVERFSQNWVIAWTMNKKL